jgi:hypothetical protein
MSTTRAPTPAPNPVPEAELLMEQFFAWMPDASTRQRILVDYPAKLYGF